jgi:hypothetical protein
MTGESERRCDRCDVWERRHERSCETHYERGLHGGRRKYWDGRCRRKSPGQSGWPFTNDDDWCGEFTPKPTKQEAREQ